MVPTPAAAVPIARPPLMNMNHELDDLPEHPPGHLPDRPPVRRAIPNKPPRPRPLLFYEENEKYFEFTNLAPYPVVSQWKEYPTSEHLFQAKKFLGYAPSIAERIRTISNDPRVASEEGNRNSSAVRSDWREKEIEIMEEVLELKFTQHQKLRRLLLDTGERYLIFNSGKYDDFWGNGADGKGRNELGKALMRLREMLRQ
ncbi:hypothetical protein FRC00_010306 [Tulasnella sp. 408]|nr:hypothetical protein FRC00_010306 [Tulasnella sp. 408]